jgi:hypothetical protein
MNNNPAILDQIQQYLSQQMTEEERADFTQKIEGDSLLKDDVDKLSLLKNIAERQRLRDEIKSIHQQKMTEWNDSVEISPVKKLNYWKISGGFAVAASVAMVCFLTFSDVNYKPISSETERGNIENQDLVLKKFDESIRELETGNKKGWHEKNVYQNSYETFKKVKAEKNLRPYYKDAADWYSVVALVKSEEYQKADELLKNIESKTDYKFGINTVDKWKMKWKILINK